MIISFVHGQFICMEFMNRSIKSCIIKLPRGLGKLNMRILKKGVIRPQRNVLQATEVASEKYGYSGKIDIYDIDKKFLIERKFKVKKIYDGYRYQLYAQMFGLQEMGFEVKNLFIHSLSDNKRYEIKIPSKKEIREFESVINQIKNLDIQKCKILKNKEKCNQCIYKILCH